MQSNIEIEAKVLLTKQQYDDLINTLHVGTVHREKQINHYIDNDKRELIKNDIALRVREQEDFIMTLKTPLSEGLLEKNQELTWRQYDNLEDDNIFPEGNIKNFIELCGFDTASLKFITSLTTYRCSFNYDDAQIDLDENFYGKNNDIIDYELGVTSNSLQKAEETAKEMLNKIGVKEFSFKVQSKQSRAIASL